MNLYLRILWFILRFKFLKRKTKILDPVISKFIVLPNDLDINLHMNNGRYLTVMDLGRFEFLAQTGLLKACLKYRWSPVLGSVKIDYRRSLKLWQRYTIVTQLLYWDEKWFYMRQIFESKNKIIAHAIIKGIFLAGREKVSSAQVMNSIDEMNIQKPELHPAIEAVTKSNIQ